MRSGCVAVRNSTLDACALLCSASVRATRVRAVARVHAHSSAVRSRYAKFQLSMIVVLHRPLGTDERKRKASSCSLDRSTVASTRWNEIALAFVVVVSGNNTVEK